MSELAEINRELKIQLPVYLLVTKCDLVAGFTEYFDDLPQEGRAQVWGVQPRACAPYRARTKGKTEAGVKYVKRNALAPDELLTSVRVPAARALFDRASEILGFDLAKVCFEGPAEDLRANFDAFVDAIVRAKPAGAKGKYLKKAAVSSTMGPGIKVQLDETVG